MERVKQELEYLLKHAHTGKILREGLQTVIVGRPNVGKSSLLNTLLSEERAIVSEYAGTTRDVIEEQLLLGSVPLVLVDTAGIRQTEDYVEKIGVARSKERLDKAELAVVVLDGSQPLNEEDEEILNAVAGKPCVIIVNKGDRPQVNDLTALQKRFGKDRVLLYLQNRRWAGTVYCLAAKLCLWFRACYIWWCLCTKYTSRESAA